MKNTFILSFLLLALGIMVTPSTVTAKNTLLTSATSTATTTNITTGNGAINGPHYNLNIIGMQNIKTEEMVNGDGHVIFVPLTGKTSIKLAEGSTFNVLDANGTDGNGATFQLPNPDPDNDGITTYRVYARTLGKPAGKADMNTCAMSAGIDGVLGTTDDEQVCSMTTLSLSRSKGSSKFVNVSKELLYINVDLNGDGITERYSLFSDALQDYFWSYDNKGLKHVQLRFYEVPTNIN